MAKPKAFNMNELKKLDGINIGEIKANTIDPKLIQSNSYIKDLDIDWRLNFPNGGLVPNKPFYDHYKYDYKDRDMAKELEIKKEIKRMAFDEGAYSVKEATAKRCLDSVTKLYEDVKAGTQTIENGYYALKLLIETISPFIDVQTTETLSDIILGWENEIKKINQEKQKLIDNTRVVEFVEITDSSW